MKQFVMFLLLIACCSGCASIGARCGQADPPTYPGIYPGPRSIVHEMVTPRGVEHNILIWPVGIIDFPLSAALDTVLLPIDLPYWAFTRPPTNHPITTPDSNILNPEPKTPPEPTTE